jgi:hypothetical protein
MSSQKRLKFLDELLPIHLSSIRLEQNSPSSPKVYECFGSVTRTTEGQLELTVLEASAQFDDVDQGEAFGGECLGESTPETEFYSLVATDTEGREWKSHRVKPSPLFGFLTSPSNPSGAIIYGELIHTSHLPYEAEEASVDLRFIRAVDSIECLYNRNIALNEGSYTTVAAFSACGLDFLVTQGSSLVLKAISQSDILPSQIETRICEALQFITGNSLFWVALEIHQKNHKSIHIRSSLSIADKISSYPPLRFTEHMNEEHVWILFGKYLEYILDYSKPSLHPISGWIRSVIAARETATLEVLILVISVAVEHIVTETPSLRSPSGFMEYDLNAEITKVKEWICQSTLNDSFERRLKGALDGMKRPNAIDCLKSLESRDLINDDLVNAWKKGRNKYAHGGIIKSSKLKEALILSNKITVLLNHLIFLIIGYTGEYTDYGEIGWTIRNFDNSLVDVDSGK